MVTLVKFDGPEDLPPEDIIAPAWYVNGFPKAGTHLVTAMLRPFARPMPPGKVLKSEWVTSFAFAGWTADWLSLHQLLYTLCGCKAGYFHKGHCGHLPEIERALYYNGTAMLFVYRDLRDVAVSQAHHIISDDERFKHHHKDEYRDLGGFDEVLEAVICGLWVEDATYGGIYYPGLFERWEQYAPWLDVEWVFPVEYGAALADMDWAARAIVEYGLERLACVYDIDLGAMGAAADRVTAAMVENARDTRNSPTFRRGGTGGWRERFTQRHKDLFKEYDGGGWLVRLGFEQDDNW